MSSLHSLLHIFRSRKMAALLLLGFYSGLPLFLTSRTLQLWMQDAQIELGAITLFGLVSLPYSLKFIWAPLLDRFNLPWLGLRRGWILLMQAGLAVAIGVMALQQPAQNAQVLQFLAINTLIIAFLSATQDVVGDAYRTDILDAHERETGASLWVFGYRVALFATSSLALVLADFLPWNLIYGMIAVLMALGIGVTLWAPPLTLPDQDRRATGWSIQDILLILAIVGVVTTLLGGVISGAIPLPVFYWALAALLIGWIALALFIPEDWLTSPDQSQLDQSQSTQSLQDAVILPLRDFLHNFGLFKGVTILVFILLYKLGDSLVGITGNLFLREIGFSKSEIGAIQGGMGFLATTVGVLVGGVVLTKIGTHRALWVFGALQLVSNLGYYALALTGKSYSLLVLAINIENFCAGLVTVVTVAFLMSLCTHHFTTTQFALFSSLMAIGRDILSAPAGDLARSTGWPIFFLLTLVAALPGLTLLPIVAPWKEKPAIADGP